MKHFEVIEEETISLAEIIIINNEGTFNYVWSFIDSIVCILSAYYYSYMTCFDFKSDQHSYFYAMIALEVYFGIVIILKFITDFKKEGEKVATKDFLLVA